MEVVNARSRIIYMQYLPLNKRSKVRTRWSVKSPLRPSKRVASPCFHLGICQAVTPLLTTLLHLRRVVLTVLVNEGCLTCFQYYRRILRLADYGWHRNMEDFLFLFSTWTIER